MQTSLSHLRNSPISFAQEDFGNSWNNLKTTFERCTRTNRSAHRLSVAFTATIIWYHCPVAFARSTVGRGRVSPRSKGKLFFKLFLLFLF